jgi:hypothetical protein
LRRATFVTAFGRICESTIVSRADLKSLMRIVPGRRLKHFIGPRMAEPGGD